MKRFRRLKLTVMFRNEFRRLLNGAREVDGLSYDSAGDTAYITDKNVYIFSRDMKYYTKIAIDKYLKIRNKLNKKEIIIL
ncbi:MAG TPA: hypothetical protein ENF47_02985 [Thermoprotei archaeon]|nr:hypothetical protein [Thermoprotei archaeon]